MTSESCTWPSLGQSLLFQYRLRLVHLHEENLNQNDETTTLQAALVQAASSAKVFTIC